MRGLGRVLGAIACCVAFWGGTAATAQERAPVRGRVVEAGSGAAVVGAEVRATGHAATAATSATGEWTLSLPAGTHDLIVEHVSFASGSVRISTGASAVHVVRLTRRPLALGELVVTASRRLQQLKDVPIATEVIGREELERSGAADLSAVLTERTGITLEGGHPVGAGLMLQGLGSERVLVLLDGQPFIGRIAGGLDLSRIPTAMIERVEVVKGPQSILYGSEAMAGVVNIITRAPERGAWEAAAGVTGGSQDRLDITGRVLGGFGSAAYAVDGGRRLIELVPGHAGDAGTFARRWDGNARVQWRAAPSLSVHAGTLLLDESQRWRTGTLYHFADNMQTAARVGAVHTRGSHRFTPTLYATEFRHLARRSTLPQAVEDESAEAEVQRLVEAELLYDHTTDRLAFDAGIEARRESIRSDRVAGDNRALHTLEPFAQATWSGAAWSLVPGGRVSWSEQWGIHFTPRVAALLRPAARLALRASIGQGFRAPSFKELYMEFLNTGAGAGYRVRGNPDLRPETSTSLSGSAEWVGDRLYARVQMYYNRFDNFIETRQLADDGGISVYEYGNIDNGETRGTELEVGATWGGLRAEAGYGWLSARDRATRDALLGRPTHTARASITSALPFGLRGSVSGTYTGDTPVSRNSDGTVVQRGALTRIDTRIAQALPGGFELSAGVDNVLDATLDGYPGYLGRQIYIGVGWAGARTQEGTQ
jgi:outer membrane receptor for ferrienterochelin and colicins